MILISLFFWAHHLRYGLNNNNGQKGGGGGQAIITNHQLNFTQWAKAHLHYVRERLSAFYVYFAGTDAPMCN